MEVGRRSDSIATGSMEIRRNCLDFIAPARKLQPACSRGLKCYNRFCSTYCAFCNADLFSFKLPCSLCIVGLIIRDNKIAGNGCCVGLGNGYNALVYAMSLILDCRLEFLVRRKSFIGYTVLKVEMMEMWRAESLAAAEYIAGLSIWAYEVQLPCYLKARNVEVAA